MGSLKEGSAHGGSNPAISRSGVGRGLGAVRGFVCQTQNCEQDTGRQRAHGGKMQHGTDIDKEGDDQHDDGQFQVWVFNGIQ